MLLLGISVSLVLMDCVDDAGSVELVDKGVLLKGLCWSLLPVLTSLMADLMFPAKMLILFLLICLSSSYRVQFPSRNPLCTAIERPGIWSSCSCKA